MSSAKGRINGREAGLFLLYLGLGLCSGSVWSYIANLPALPDWHQQMIGGTAPAPNQFRPLTPWLAEWLRLILPGHNLYLSYLLLRGLVTGVTLFVFDRYMRVWFAPAAAAAGALALAAIIPFTYYRVIQESDPIALLMVTLSFWALARERDLWLIPLVLIGTLNRETSALIPAVYFLSRWRERPAKELAWRTAVLVAAWALVYFGMIAVYGWRPYYCDTVMWPQNIQSVYPTLQLVLVYGAIWVLAALGARQAPAMLRRTIWLVPPYIALHYVVALVNEVRLFLPLAPILIPSSWWALFPEACLGGEASKRSR